MKIPDGLKINNDEEDHILKLEKSLYGLKQASRCWNKTFSKFLCNFELKKSQADPCVFSGRVNGSMVILALYVDDGLIISKSSSAINNVIEALKEFVTIKILDASNFCELQIFKDTKNGTMFIN